jgi:CotH kinase protein
MKKAFFLFLCLSPLCCMGQTVTLDSSNLPILILETTGAASIPDEPKIEAQLRIIDKGNGQINHVTDAANVYEGYIGIELRGSSSQLFYDKKPYSFELRNADGTDNPQPILGMPKEADWSLIQPLNDKSLMRDMMAYRLAGQIMPWAPRLRYVEVLLNGEYMGVYMLTERIKRDKDRVNIHKMTSADTAGVAVTGGYMLAFDKIPGAPGGGFGGDWVSPYPPYEGAWQSSAIQVKYPKPEDIQPQQRAYIENYINAFEDALYAWTPNQPGPASYHDWIDTDSWVDYLLVNEISKNIDAYRLSAWFYKDRDSLNHRLRQGPVWDYNISFGIGDYCGGSTWTGWAKDFNQVCPDDLWVIHFWWEKLCRDHDFQVRIRERWKNLRNSIWVNDSLTQKITQTATLLQEAQKRNFTRWPVLGQYVWPNAFFGPTYAAEVDYLKNWLLQRVAWMDENIDAVGPSTVRDIIGQDGPISVFPNPIHDGILHLEYDYPAESKVELLLTDPYGRRPFEVFVLPVGKPMHYEVKLGDILHKGMYVAQFVQDGQLVQTLKLIVL